MQGWCVPTEFGAGPRHPPPIIAARIDFRPVTTPGTPVQPMPSSNADALDDPRHPVAVGKHALPHEHEQLLRAQPAADDACVIGIPGPMVGEQIDARVVPVEGATVTRREILDATRPATRRSLEAFPTSRAASTPSR